MARRRGEEDETYHVRAGIKRDVERFARGKAANFDDQGHVTKALVRGTATEPKGRLREGRVLQRRALLVSPRSPISALLRGAQALRIGPLRHWGTATQIGKLRPRLARISFVPTCGAAPMALPKPSRRAARQYAKHRDRNDDDEKRQRDPERGFGRVEGVE